MSNDRIAHARKLYYQGIDGNKAAEEQADSLFSELYRQQPDDALVTVYFGSLRLAEADRTWALWKKNSLSKQGVQLMDRAVASAPENLEVRFVRGATERELPAFFGRKQQALEDIAAIVRTPEPTLRQGLEPRLASASFYYYGIDCASAGQKTEAAKAWRTAMRLAPDSPPGQSAAEKLKALP